MNLLNRLTSRKLWLAVSSFIVFIVNEQYTEAVLVISAYLAAEGAIDVVHNKKTSISSITKSIKEADDSPDFRTIVPGNMYDEQKKEQVL